ncbi:MAG: GtrA family protein [Gammaproteobacteria bacterium]|jgi:putative flippase GtrA|nr:GtrA family protein [Gammaproteobacteria bacterium]
MVVYKQFFRFVIVGLASNLLLYLAYLLITAMGMGHKTAMSVLYLTGVCLTFAFNRNWTFGHDGRVPAAFAGYLALYAFGYLVNLFALFMLVDRMGLDHRWVQGVMILALAVFFFLVQKFLVFRKS